MLSRRCLTHVSTPTPPTHSLLRFAAQAYRERQCPLCKRPVVSSAPDDGSEPGERSAGADDGSEPGESSEAGEEGHSVRRGALPGGDSGGDSSGGDSGVELQPVSAAEAAPEGTPEGLAPPPPSDLAPGLSGGVRGWWARLTVRYTGAAVWPAQPQPLPQPQPPREASGVEAPPSGSAPRSQAAWLARAEEGILLGQTGSLE